MIDDKACKIIFLSTTVFLISFLFLLVFVQKQGNYIIFYDFWLNFQALKNGNLNQFIFHDMHTNIMASIIWYADVYFANGSLKFANSYVFLINLLSICFLFLVLKNTCYKVHKFKYYPFIVTAFAFAMWLSPSNASIFSNTLTGILGSTILFLSILTVFFEFNCRFIKERSTRAAEIVYIVIILLGFSTFETFILVPLIISILTFLRKDYKTCLLNIAVVLLLAILYLTFIPKSLIATYSTESRNIFVALKNFLLLLSSHYNLLFIRLHIDLKLATFLGQCLSILQLIIILIVVDRNEILNSNRHPLFIVSVLLIGLGFFSIGLATVMRFSVEPVYNAVARYTQYSMMFSIGVFLLVSAIQVRANALKLKALTIIFSINFLYLLTEYTAFLVFNYHQGSNIGMTRLEMPIYAMHSGSNLNLGPHGPNNPKADILLRTDLHDFLKEHQLSVFASDGYKSVGKKLPASIANFNEKCVMSYDYSTVKKWWPAGYQLMVFKGIDNDNGFFLVSDANRVVTNFSFAIQPLGLEAVYALLPVPLAKKELVSFVRFKSGKVTNILDCY